MRRERAEALTIDEISRQFVELCLRLQKSADYDDVPKYNKLMPELMALVNELRRREGDQRRFLTSLYRHGNVFVRLMAAQSTLAVAPAEARGVLEKIRDSREMPQALDAGMTLSMLDSGMLTPS